jgi:hypothetical protein
MKYLKANTVKRDTETEINMNVKICIPAIYPIVEPIKKVGRVTKVG